MSSVDERFNHLQSSSIELQTYPLVWHDRKGTSINYGPIETVISDLDEKTIHVSYCEDLKYAIDMIYLLNKLYPEASDMSNHKDYIRIRISNSDTYELGQYITFHTIYVCKIVSKRKTILFLMSDNTARDMTLYDKNSNIRVETVSVYTDGGCRPNPGVGGWGFVVVYEDHIIYKEFGSSEQSTNNRMELTAAIKGLSYVLERGYTATIYTDSKYVKDGITKWINVWYQNNWKTSKGKDVKNKQLWETLHSINGYLCPNWEWVKGHDNNKFNDIADKLATEGINQTS